MSPLAVSRSVRAERDTLDPVGTSILRSPLRLVEFAGLLLCGAFAFLAWYSRQPHPVRIGMYLGVVGCAWLALLVAFFGARNVKPSQLIPRLWIGAIVLRAFGLLAEPALDDDHFRFLWDGYVFARSGNPYEQPPAAFFAHPSVPAQFQPILDAINHPDVPTIYSPLCQGLFLVSYWISPAALWPLKTLLIGLDLAALAWLRRLISPRNALLYAWCPLVIQETAFSAHPDVLGVALLLGALFASQRQRLAVTAIFCGLAMGAKIFAVLLVPFILLRLSWRYWVLTALVLVSLYVPFWLQGSLAEYAGLRVFLRDWEFNSSLYSIVSALLGRQTAASFCFSLFAILWAMTLRNWLQAGNRGIPPGDWIYGGFFLLAAVVNPWYLLWLAPFVALRPSVAGLTALAAVSLSYLYGLHLGRPDLDPYAHPEWVRPLEYGLLIPAAWLDASRSRAQ